MLAISPFNFCAIGANLPSAPALMGNTVLWKPATTSVLSNYATFQVFQEAGLPAGVISFLPSAGKVVGEAINHPDFAGLHFTGSTATFNQLWQQIGANLGKYKGYPRIVGETGGKNFHVVHPSADVDHAVFNTVRAAFEYQVLTVLPVPVPLNADWIDLVDGSLVGWLVGLMFVLRVSCCVGLCCVVYFFCEQFQF